VKRDSAAWANAVRDVARDVIVHAVPARQEQKHAAKNKKVSK